MSYLTIAAEAELASLQTLVSNAKPFLEAGSVHTFDARCGVLLATLQPRQGQGDLDPNPFDFGTLKPLRTKQSKEYKGDGNNAAAVYAEFTFNWRLRRIAQEPGRYEVHGGGVRVGFHRPDATLLRQFHYDVCRGGPDEKGGLAHHPFTHFQYGGGFSDLPRLPSLVFTPTDTLEQLLMDLWPRSWPSTASGMKAKSALARHYKAQGGRIETCAQQFVRVAKAARQPLRGLQDRLIQNLAI